jgi:hypothetical protein
MSSFFSKLNLYDFLGYIIPGSLIVLILNSFFENVLDTNFILNVNDGSIVETTSFIILSYFIGILMHELSQIIEKYFLKKIWGGFPSERFLLDNDEKYSEEFKNELKKVIESKYNIKLNNTRKKNQEAFNLIYSKVQKLDGNDKIQLFNTIYGMCRSLFSGVIVSSVFYIIKFFIEYGENNMVNMTYIMLFVSASYLLYRRSTRFSKRFADYVYRDFYNYYKENI